MISSWTNSNSVTGRNIVATSQPLAVEAGIAMLKAGGNAVDSALAAAICLTVVEPTSNGIGSDAFAQVWDVHCLHGLNGSGRSPQAWHYEQFAKYQTMPTLGWETVTVPGAVSVWVALSERFGKLPFERLFEPAIRHARDGYAVTPITASAWQRAESRYQSMPRFGALFLPDGRAPKAGEIFSSNEMAATLSELATTRGESFYRGRLAEIIAATSRAETGQMTVADLAAHQCDWVEPIGIGYRELTVHEIPPNGQGLAALIALGILERFNLSDYPLDSADSVHLQVECMKLGLAAIARHLADPNWMTVSVEQLLAPERLDQLAANIDMAQAHYPADQPPHEHGTVYLTTADQSGMMVSFIQSNFMGFGSGVVIPGTGISLQNRGHGFSLIKGHPNQVDGGKRPYHTIIPGFVTQYGRPLMSFGVMGGHMQAQGHLQMITRIFDYRFDPQTASDYHRWYLTENYDLAVEPGFSPELLAELSQRGHRVRTDLDQSQFGGAQLIYKGEGGYYAGSDHRKDGLALPL